MAAELLIQSAPPGATIQDQGRVGWLSAGVPPSGPLDYEMYAAANLAAGNDVRAAALEIPLGPLRLVARGGVRISVDGAPASWLEDGADLVVPPAENAVRYLAVYGGVDVPILLGSRATLTVAAFGGFAGRPLRAGDLLPVGEPAPLAPRPPPRDLLSPPGQRADQPAMLRVWPGPHPHRFDPSALESLFAGTFRVSARSDRVGTRLDGDKIPRRGDDRAPPVPMVRGAMQITTDGTPIVLGPDHPVTGGYPVLAVVDRASQGVLARLRPNHAVRFLLADGTR